MSGPPYDCRALGDNELIRGEHKSALEKIEEQHRVVNGWCSSCEREVGDVCRVVTLARALDEAMARLVLVAGVLPKEEGRIAVVGFAGDAERTLEEVAGD